tara:strand:- start:869 stop:1138 length:270 start_codon:yes stop_codon:yes gene_type:complete
MAKKLRGELFYLSANDLKTGEVVYYSDKSWSKDLKKARVIRREEIEEFERIANLNEKTCKIISPIFVELSDNGKIKKLRDIIRYKGITF